MNQVMDSWVEIDGSRGEGGGQILRSSLALALLTGRRVRLTRIRAGRAKPGLAAQHLASVRAAARVGSAHVTGDALGATELSFEPGPVVSGHYKFDIGTAGAVGLVLHTVYLPLALRGAAGSTVEVTGGTHVRQAPSASFLALTWAGWLERIGLPVGFKLLRTGFFPRGGGHVTLTVPPAAHLRGLEIGDAAPRGRTVGGFAAVAGLPADVAARMARRAEERLAQAGLRTSLKLETWTGGPGAVIGLSDGSEVVPALFVGLGERGKPAERVAEDAARELIEHRAGGGVDEHSADQLVLPLAFASGFSSFPVARVTRHLLTNVETLGYFVTRRITVAGEEGQPGRVTIEAS